MNALLDALRKFGRALPKRPSGDGWYTLEELASAESVTLPTIRYRMQCAQQRGVTFERATGTRVDQDGKAKRTTYYRLKNGKP
jgi:hypothetical protein